MARPALVGRVRRPEAVRELVGGEEVRRLFFRFYDPRVLGTFAAFITPEQHREFMAGLDLILYEVKNRLLRMIP